ncbi:monothiol glutaredoxin grx5 [Malassezia japonica]|uniref:Monothiol glutaredoxin-5, mitochondrial n=1 Tax=Malassezia japonica TaxID=223818 RepID=A0AAF0F0G2_9BASI|nr:monothiol glutaredoxin grx5 [Malassezia japonica]WFD37571.1 monothiol glutaredoxin grx5 [Malassezia japonica]
MFVRQAASTFLRPSLAVPRVAAHSAITPSLVRLLSTQTRTKIQNAVKEDPLVVFMKGSPEMPQCGFSRAVLQILQVQGVKPDLVATYNCLEDQELRDGIKEFSDWPTIPQVYINGEFVGGCDIMLNMHQTGELESMLQKAGLLIDAAGEDKPKAE